MVIIIVKNCFIITSFFVYAINFFTAQTPYISLAKMTTEPKLSSMNSKYIFAISWKYKMSGPEFNKYKPIIFKNKQK